MIQQLEPDLFLIDHELQGVPRTIASYLLTDGDDLTLIETGPTTTMETLLGGVRAAGFDPERITRLVVTHIHLDHAGAAGALLQRLPRARLFVHRVGAPHMADPSRLISSATRIYGERMESLWGEMRPIAADRIRSLADGEVLSVAGRNVTALFTPGHATHHIAYWDEASGDLFTGDVAGVRIPGTTYVCPPTPPPDIDPEAWRASIARLQALPLQRICLTHFGPIEGPSASADHLARLLPELDAFLALGLEAVADGKEIREPDQTSLTAAIHARMADALRDDPEALAHLEWATPSYMAAMGLVRWATKRGGKG